MTDFKKDKTKITYILYSEITLDRFKNHSAKKYYIFHIKTKGFLIIKEAK